MAGRELPNLGLIGFWTLGEDEWNDENDLNLLKLSILTQGTVLAVVSETPGAPADGDTYIFDATHPTNPNAVAVYDVDTWKYFEPNPGWLIYDQDGGRYMQFDGTAWLQLALPSAPIPVSGQEANYEAVLADANGYIRMNLAVPGTFTIPPNDTVAFPIGTRLYIEQRGAGVITITPGSGVTLRSRGSVYNTGGQYAVATVVKVAADTWVLSGDVA